MESFVRLSPEEQALIFQETAARISLPIWSVEKDFWVCWTLRRLFRLPEIGDKVTFKGGTSLSKVFGLVKRFSEDIDIVLDRRWLGYKGGWEPNPELSKTKRNDQLKELRTLCEKQVQDRLLPALIEDFAHSTPGEWALTVDEAHPDTLLFRYPRSGNDTGPGYIRQLVKIETGARSEIWPAKEGQIRPFVAEIIPSSIENAETEVRVILPERTFWDKATLLHVDNQAVPEKPPKDRLTRHAYDLYSMIQAGIGASALADLDLFRRAVKHEEIFFARGQTNYGKLHKGGLQLLPPPDRLDHWRADYKRMEEMFYGKTIGLDEILIVLGEFEVAFKTAWETGNEAVE